MDIAQLPLLLLAPRSEIGTPNRSLDVWWERDSRLGSVPEYDRMVIVIADVSTVCLLTRR